MPKELILKKCKNCNAVVRVMEDCECISCCGENMITVVPNSVDAAIEKHVPEYEVKGDKIVIRVNHVMEEEHYIEWIAMVSDKEERITYLKPGDKPEVTFEYVKGAKLYAYCNKHGLWKKEVE